MFQKNSHIQLEDSCSLQNDRQTPRLIYKTNVTNSANDKNKIYLGLAEPTFKERYLNHSKDFNPEKYIKAKFSKQIWSFKERLPSQHLPAQS